MRTGLWVCTAALALAAACSEFKSVPDAGDAATEVAPPDIADTGGGDTGGADVGRDAAPESAVDVLVDVAADDTPADIPPPDVAPEDATTPDAPDDATDSGAPADVIADTGVPTDVVADAGVDIGTVDADAPPPDACGLAECGGACVDTQTDVRHCGACGRACTAPTGGVATCAMGACGFRCDVGFHRCGEACASDVSAMTCGAACAPCPAPANATPTCDRAACVREVRVAAVAVARLYAEGTPWEGVRGATRGAVLAQAEVRSFGGSGFEVSRAALVFPPLAALPSGVELLDARIEVLQAGMVGDPLHDVPPQEIHVTSFTPAGTTIGPDDYALARWGATSLGMRPYRTFAPGTRQSLPLNVEGLRVLADPRTRSERVVLGLRTQYDLSGIAPSARAAGTLPGLSVSTADAVTLVVRHRCSEPTCGFQCNAGFGDCDGNAANGCETDTNATATHCGACGRACTTGQRCDAGRCEPDRSIVFYSDRDGNLEIYAMAEDGSGVRRLTNDPAEDRYPRWSRDGQQIAFLTSRYGGPSIAVMNPNGSDVRRVADCGGDACGSFSWSPDNQWIYFSRQRATCVRGIQRVRSDGSAPPERVYDPDAFNEGPDVSPDGLTLALNFGCAAGTSGVGTLRLAAPSAPARWPAGSSSEGEQHPRWSPNGSTLAWTRGGPGSAEVVIATMGGTVQNVSRMAGSDEWPAWSSDGRRIVFGHQDGDWEIFVINVDGTGARRLTENSAFDGYPDWRWVPSPPRPVGPLSTATVTSRRPTLRWQPDSWTGARVEICRDRACTTVEQTLDVTGTSARPTADLAPGVHFWRLFGRRGATTGTLASPVWEFFVGRRETGTDTSWGARSDLNGDGISEVVVGAYLVAPSGRTYVYTGGTGGPGTTPATVLPCSFPVPAGDVNGDGFGDLACGSIGTGTSSQVAIYHGGPSGIATTPNVTISFSAGPGYFYNRPVASAGDLNGDGYADLAVGARAVGTDAARVLLYFGSPGGLDPSSVRAITGLDPRAITDYISVASGDLNADGRADLVVGTSEATAGPGHVYVHLNSATGIPDAPSITLTGMHGPGEFCAGPSVTFGFAVAANGDVDGNGYSDLLVGAPGRRADRSGGRAYLFLGGAAGPSGTPALTLSPGSDVGIGQVPGFISDADGDGYDELVVTDPCHATNEGAVYVHRGGPSGPRATPDLTLAGPTGSDLGTGLSGSASDVNGDAYGDLVIGLPRFPSYADRGRIHVHLGGPSGLSTTPSITRDAPDGGGFGWLLARALDVQPSRGRLMAACRRWRAPRAADRASAFARRAAQHIP